MARSELGYRGMYLLVDRASSSALVISLWDTGDDARAYEESGAYQAQLIIASDYLASPVVCSLYEVDDQA